MGPSRDLTLLSLHSWEFVLSIDFDWQFISGKKLFRWPLVRFAGIRSRCGPPLPANPALDILFHRPLRPAICVDRDVSRGLITDKAASNSSPIELPPSISKGMNES
jgi:hypothetical protein